MSALALAPVADKLGKLIPRLGSNYDGEVIATARAIGKTLENAGLSWHDVAGAIAKSSVPAPYAGANPQWRREGEEPAPLWGELRLERRIAWLALLSGQPWLSDWEIVFVGSIAANPWRAFSQKQQLILNRLIGRAFSVGLRA